MKCPTDKEYTLIEGKCVVVNKCEVGFLEENGVCVRRYCDEKLFTKVGDECVLKKCPEDFKKVGDQCLKVKCSEFATAKDGKCGLVSCPDDYTKVGETCIKRFACENGYTLKDGYCLKDCEEGQELVEGMCRTYKCKDSKHFTLEDGKCVRTSCPDNYKFSNNECFRVICEDDTYTLKVDECVKLSKCPTHFEQNLKTMKCVRKSCPEGFTLFEGQCWNRKCTPNEKRVNGICQFFKCPTDYKLNEDKDCIMTKCPEGSAFNDDNECVELKCPEFFKVSDDKKKCVRESCPPKFKLNDKKICVREFCKAPFTLKDDLCVRLTCPEGYTMVNEMCVAKCPETWVMNTKTETCEKKSCVSTHFKIKDGVCKAVSCPVGFTLNKELGECSKVVCPADHLYDDSVKKCIKYKCPEHFKMTSLNTCERESCPPNFIYKDKKCYTFEKCAENFKRVGE